MLVNEIEAKELSEALKVNRTLTSLNLCGKGNEGERERKVNEMSGLQVMRLKVKKQKNYVKL